ncbi:hypothetical protein L8N14_003380 [Serratia marcescens]|uniref:hypothetical protein n=1 Tax=Serratia marcescens TaxID=615 RepID=UPI001C9452D7|nr:hypothetical protein [Serratia marcescens]MBY4847112.1 hypothetical protein [Serratia marcescens]MCH9865112.1 hypothetical protein [Serratia marcescens]
MKKSCHVFNYYKNKELLRDVVPERRIVMVVHHNEALKWCVRIILVHEAIINQILAVKQPFFNVFASILITNSNFHDAPTVQAGAARGEKGEQIMLTQLAVFAAAPVVQAGGRVFFVLFGLAGEAITHAF